LKRDKLEGTLKDNRRVLLIASDFSKTEEALAILDGYKDIKVLSTDPASAKHENVQEISVDQEKEFLDLYHMYEFSDKFLVLENSDQYGSMLNYVDGGLISFSEALKSLVSD
jgi:hypothetical protein